MNQRRSFFSILTISLLLASPLLVTAQQSGAPAKPTTVVMMEAPSQPAISLTELLPDKLAGAKATGESQQFAADKLAQLVADNAVIYQEYKTSAAALRLYNNTVRVELFQLADPHSAFGLFTYSARQLPGKPLAKAFGANAAQSPDGIIFWKNQFFIRVKDSNQAAKTASLQLAIAAAVAEKIPAGESPAERPALFDSLPKNSLVAESQRYFLGPESLNAYVERARDMFSFDGEAEAVVAEFRKASETEAKEAMKANPAAKPSAAKPSAANPAAPTAKNLQLVIVEYHTPQFATDALTRLNGYVATLTEEERHRFIVKRVGNFIVEATNYDDPEFAESLVNSIEYPYVVKWLQNPAIPTDDPFRIQKAGQMLVSTFSLIGLTGAVVLLCGSILGTTIFFRRRKQQREFFSDAGGMIGLHLDPIEDALLGLPPANDRGE
jgi:hypothetical protein